MSTGPQGQQGQQGAYGPRGVTGAFGWGYGTTTGPTGSIGAIKITTPGTSTITITSANINSLFRIKNATSYTDSNQITTSSVYISFPSSGLASSNVGNFWTFSNDLANSLTLLQTSTSIVLSSIQPYAHTTFVYNGGTGGSIGDYTLF